MKSKDQSRMAVAAALIIIGCCISSICSCSRRRGYQQRQLNEAIRTWEDEGGAIMADDEDEPELRPHTA